MLDLLASAIVSGVLLGGFYAAMTAGVAVSFGLLDVVNIAHPFIIIACAYATVVLKDAFGLDPVVSGLLLLPFAYLVGYGFYLLYHRLFEAREKNSLRGLVFFFGIMFLIQVGLLLQFGVDYQSVQTAYNDVTWVLGPVELPLRMLVPFAVSVVVVTLLSQFLARTVTGRALRAVSQDGLAVALMGLDPVRIKAIGFGISVALAAIAGALLIVIQPVDPSMGAVYIGTTFAICVLGGMGSIAGTLIAAILLGVAESVTATFWGPSWSPALAFGTLILVIGLRPTGIMGRR